MMNSESRKRLQNNKGNARLQAVTDEAYPETAEDIPGPANRCPSINNGFRCQRVMHHVSEHESYDKDHDLFIYWDPPYAKVAHAFRRIEEGLPPF